MRAALTAIVMAGGLVFAAILGVRSLGALEGLELAVYDRHIRLRPAAATPEPPIVLITITERDIQQLGTWPVPDGVLAKALESLSRAGARTVGLDIYRDIPVPPGHEQLNAVLAANAQIVAPMLLPQRDKAGVAPPRVLKGTDRVGFTDIVVDADGTVRRGVLLMDDGRDRKSVV